ncbi:MAG: PfkB domain protein [Bacteroidetes bacterium]|nr:PfkB domain protein [Bacteroidota bacterium]
MSKKVLCLGNALVDIITQLESDSILETLNLPKGSMQLVDNDVSKMVQNATSALKSSLQTGGSAANTANGIANLGVGSAFIGMVGEDKLGEFYINDMVENSIEPRFFKSKTTSTGCAVALVSKDGERTFATYLGAAIELSAQLLSRELFQGYDYFHIEGYLIVNNDLIRKAIELAKQEGLKVSIDFASYNVVEDNLDFLKEICKSVDIIFANEQEAKAFTNKEAEEALEEISQICEISVVKIGKKGSLIKQGDNKIVIGKRERTCIDTTGAGDMYAAGFLAGLCLGRDLEVCGQMGSILASEVIEVYGAKMDSLTWDRIKKEIDSIK